MSEWPIAHCGAGIPEAEHPAMSGFVRAYTRDSKDCFVLVVQSEPLFKDLPKEGSAIPRISRKDIGSEYYPSLACS